MPPMDKEKRRNQHSHQPEIHGQCAVTRNQRDGSGQGDIKAGEGKHRNKSG
jgi:hypothetical protein